ncbi:type IV secretion protein Rhs [Pedobacter yulinensis]|uniref:Type IV secretion protein Rhs n=1 Tax=Pedobacter yulinensis TaxID=2126353 RepID=A0A2T3HM13_9SPHI|nr:phage baseplate assembly protein V [Pedobacter yulinensis]PST83469.1 type IV secretion protein Rhs [Pedobacter yulinensis]
MEKKLIAEINIEDAPILHFASFRLKQKFNAHHEFELRFNHDKMGAPGLISLDSCRNFMGKSLTASFGYTQGQMQLFSGIVTKVELAQSHGYHGIIIVSGYSPTILIDRGRDLGSYLDKDLNTIAQIAIEDTATNDLKLVTNSSRKAAIDYVIQYKESDFSFLNRLSATYHEWFFYDGQQLHFGKPDDLKEVALFYGRDVQNLQYGMEVAPIKSKRFSYDSRQDTILESESAGKAEGQPDLVHAVRASNSTFSKVYNQPAQIRVDSSSDIREYVENEEKARVSNLLNIKGGGDNPMVGIGTVVDISMSLRQELAFNTQSLGKYLVTGVVHHIEGTGIYHNTFEGIVANSEKIVVHDWQEPLPEMQLAKVVDNNDPQGLGRIKISFQWKCKTNDVSEWLRVVSPNAGTGDRGSNRGFFAIPEIDDQVMIAFEEGNVARPVVIGSVYHKSNVDSSPLIQNHLKSIMTRSGHLIEFDDNESTQGIKITDIHNNIIHIDTKGNNITVTALENMSLNCKNMQINVEENMNISVGKDQSTSVGNSQSTSVQKDISVTAGNNYALSASGDIQESSDTRKESVTKDFMRQSDVSNELASEIVLFSQQENMTLQSGKTVEVNSAEKSKMF